MNGSALTIDLSQAGGSPLITVQGEIDSNSVADLDAVLGGLHLDDSRVLIDMSGVEFMDSSGVSTLIQNTLRLEKVGGSLRIINPSRPVHRVLEISGVLDLFYEPQTQ